MAQVAVGYALRMAKGHAFQAPTGTRDFYPADMLRRRYIEKMWRDTSIRHGFEEIDGPTFEHLDLYTVKSGEGIVNELFSFKRAGGEKDYALRPEFTPTLARMYAAKAGGLAKPTKWFWQQSCFRAERPQRGRLREFFQWNLDLLGDESPAADAEVIACCVLLLKTTGLTSADVTVRVSNRNVIAVALMSCGVDAAHLNRALAALDKRDRLSPADFAAECGAVGLRLPDFDKWIGDHQSMADRVAAALQTSELVESAANESFKHTLALLQSLQAFGVLEWCKVDMSIVRGLAYYTGTVFEVHESGGKERAIAGGGRYDNLIELFGGPPTPAVGFGMGDVVLGNLLDDKKLMPEGKALMDKLSEPPASPRPDIFVIANDQPESIAAVRPLVAGLRRGENGVRPLHARHSYKATKNIGKLLQEASACHSRFAAILESGSEATLKNLTTGEQTPKVPFADIAGRVSTPR